MKTHYRTIVLSDIHLGTSGSKAREVTSFLKDHTCDTLILNGDIIDGWQLQKYGKWKKAHTKFFKRVIKMAEQQKTNVIYLRGNHDDFLDQVLPMKWGNVSVIRDMIYEDAQGRRMLVLHGDVFDTITTNLKWIAQLGDIGYTFLLWLNKHYNNYRKKRGLPYYSLSQAVKHKVKGAVSYISKYEEQLAELAKAKKCQGVICGHIHQPAIKQYGEILYLNSGDWVESLTGLIETTSGEWKLVYFNEQFENKETETEEVEEDSLIIQRLMAHKDVIVLNPRLIAMNGKDDNLLNA
ncbi:MAG: UDP-2,3-diacylglucosamine diphosphatase [Cytophagaceae bacterium]|jgi:UDP-2,3-diacylglucosamine pyrophosphatase LpxH|nr:UDP-2,3-diacylglucosamine diphosphatase [Cytophagaceae bacterium]